jgi:hypothetical protein
VPHSAWLENYVRPNAMATSLGPSWFVQLILSHTNVLPGYGYMFFFVNRTLALKKTSNNTKHLKKNKNYIEIFEKPFIFNLQTVSTARRRSSPNRPNVVGCRRKVAERVKKTTHTLLKLVDTLTLITILSNTRFKITKNGLREQ